MSNERELVIDASPLDVTNLGHNKTALAFMRIVQVYKARIHMSQDVFNRRVPADQRILGSEFANAQTWGKSSEMNYNRAVARYQDSGRLNAFPPESRSTAALAFYLQESTVGKKVELLTTNRAFGEAWVKAGGKLAKDVDFVTGLTGKPDYARARRLLGLPPLAITSNGVISSSRTVPVVNGPPAQVVSPARANVADAHRNATNGPRTRTGARTTSDAPDVVHPRQQPAGSGTTASRGGSTNTRTPDQIPATVDGKPVISVPRPGSYGSVPERAQTRQPPKVDQSVNVVGPNASGAARFDAARLAFQGLNRVMHLINDYLVNKQMQEAWDKSKKSVEEVLKHSPEYGALILTHFAKRPKVAQEKSGDMDFLRSFRGLTPTYGYTREDALNRYQRGPNVARGIGSHEEPYTEQWLWIETKVAFEPEKLDTPFAKFGLAKFVDGLEELTKVKFSIGMFGSGGFDDKMKSRQELGPVGREARFLYLQAPAEITYMDQGQFQTQDVNIALARAGVVHDAELKEQYIVPVVKLDSRVNPADAVAAMIYPADSYTAGLFARTRATSGDLLISKNPHLFKMVRWVKPHKIEVIRHFHRLDVPLDREPIGMWGRK